MKALKVKNFSPWQRLETSIEISVVFVDIKGDIDVGDIVMLVTL